MTTQQVDGHSLSAGVDVRGQFSAQEFKVEKSSEKPAMTWSGFFLALAIVAWLIVTVLVGVAEGPVAAYLTLMVGVAIYFGVAYYNNRNRPD